jgi:plasmid stabilization system protein ParE
MALLKVRWTRLALRHLDQACAFIAAEAPAAVPVLLERVEAALAMLCRFPEMGRPGRVEGTRELVLTGTPFILPYRVKGARIHLLAFMHGARRWPDRL